MRQLRAIPLAALILLAGQLAAQSVSRIETPGDSIARALKVLQDELGLAALPAQQSFHIGMLSIPSGSVVDTAVGVYAGTLTISGRVRRSVVVVHGDLVLAPGGVIEGDAAAVRGRILMEGGQVTGSSFTLGGDLSEAGLVAPARTAVQETWHDAGIALATLAIVIALGIGVLMFAGSHLTGTADALAAQPGRSFLFGVLAQLAMMPALVLLLVALALTILGLLLIPFAAVAFLLAVLGVGALGFLASAQVAGTALSGKSLRNLPERRARLRSLLLGILAMGTVWVVAALATAIPIAGALLRAFAAMMTWVAVTAGFGAAVISRAGRRQRATVAAAEPEPDLSWQTPTPVTGVAAARRPVSDVGARS
jgi:hypothetical protein